MHNWFIFIMHSCIKGEEKNTMLLCCTYLEGTRKSFVHTHSCTRIVKPSIIIGCWEQCNKLSSRKKLITILYDLRRDKGVGSETQCIKIQRWLYLNNSVMLKGRPCRLQTVDCADRADCADCAHCVLFFLYLYLNFLVNFFAVAIWPVTGQGFQNTKWPAVLYSQ